MNPPTSEDNMCSLCPSPKTGTRSTTCPKTSLQAQSQSAGPNPTNSEILIHAHQHYFSFKMLEEEEVSDVHIDQNQNPLDEIFRVGVDHSGQYECRPSNSQPANISLVVLEGQTFSKTLTQSYLSPRRTSRCNAV